MHIATTYRSLLKRPAFFCAVVLTLTLGIGANSAIFSVIDTVLLKPLPYPNGDRLMILFESNLRNKRTHDNPAPVRIEDWNRMNQSFASISGAYTENIAETSGELPEMLVSARVSPRFFSVLGTAPLIGRTFSPEEDLFNGPNAAVLTERLWQRRFGADHGVVGKALRVGNYTYPIIGVMPDSVRFPAADVDFWIPAKLPPLVMRVRDARWESAVGRLKEGATARSAQADLSAVPGASCRTISRDGRQLVAYRRSIERIYGGWHPPIAVDTVWRGFSRAPDHLRERGLFAAGTSTRPRARDGRAILFGRPPGTSNSRTPPRSAVPGHSRLLARTGGVVRRNWHFPPRRGRSAARR